VVGKQFFFEKKNQKTFVYVGLKDVGATLRAASPYYQKFFVSFFQKRNTSLLRWTVTDA
jgi:hypothetical protein